MPLLIAMIVIFSSLIWYHVYENRDNLFPNNNQEISKQLVDSSNSLTPTSEQTVYKLTQPTADPDSIIDCAFINIGTLKLRRSVCTKSTDCKIEKGKWYYFSSVDECKKVQNDYYVKQK